MSGCRSTTSAWKRARSWLEFCPEIPFAIHVGCCANCGPSCPEPQIAVIESPMNTTVGALVCPAGATGNLAPPHPEAKSRVIAAMARVFIRCPQGAVGIFTFGDYRQDLSRPTPDLGVTLGYVAVAPAPDFQRAYRLLLRVIKRYVVQLSAALHAEDHWIPGLQPCQRFAQGVQRIERRTIQEMQHIAGLEPEE